MRAGAEGTTMQELRFVAVSEDGRYAVLAVPGRSARFTLPIDERLRAVALGQTSRLAQYEIDVESVNDDVTTSGSGGWVEGRRA